MRRPGENSPSAAGMLFTGGTLAAFMTAGVWLGRWLDARFGWNPWGLLAGTLLGFFSAGIVFYQAVRALEKK